MNDVLAVVQARMGSARLPGKVLAELGDRPVLDWVLHRAGAASTVGGVVVATTDSAEDDVVADHCQRAGVRVVRGSTQDVLSRFARVVTTYTPQHVVRLTADNPFVDPEVIDLLVRRHLDAGNDFTTNRLPPPHRRTWPIGLDAEVSTSAALLAAHAQASQASHREHVMPWLYRRGTPLVVEVVECERDVGEVRWTIDEAADLELARRLVDLPDVTVATGWRDLLRHFDADPGLARISASVVQKSVDAVDERRD